MDKLIKVQDDLQCRIVRALENFKKSPKERRSSIDYLNTRLDLLEELWTQFSHTHMLIIQDSESEALAESTYVGNDVYNETEEAYVTYKCLVKSILSSVKPASTSEMSSSSVAEPKSTIRAEDRIKLPKITIPTFSGKYSEWVSFRDMFVSLIHTNKDLDDVQKLHYLKSHLQGEAEQMLRHIAITKDNYNISWEQLEKRYNNKKYLSNCILKRLLCQRNLVSESASALKELLDTTNECLQALKNLGIDVKSWDVIIVYLMCLKLDAESRKQWELKSTEYESELPTYQQFQTFLETRFRALEFIDPKLSRPSTSTHKDPTIPVKVHHVAAATVPSCAFCSEAHKISNCKEFSKLETDARRGFVQSHSLCFNCLGPHHSVYACRQSSRCRICRRKHHSLLHSKNITPTTEFQESKETNHSVVANAVVPAIASHSSSRDEPTTTNIRNHFSTSRKLVLLPTALVNAKSKSGQLITLRCFIDQGSEVSFIKESVVQLLGLSRIHHKSPITRLGEDESCLSSHSSVNVNIASLLDPNVKVNVHAFVLNKLTLTLPEKRVDVGFWSELSNLDLADATFNEPGRIDLLIGGDVFNQILIGGLIKGPQGAPMAQQTSLGWIISGPAHTSASELHNKISVNHVHVIDNEFLKKFWELEADPVAPDPKQQYTEEEKKCEEIFAATTKRDSSGRYVVKLPFRDETPRCTEGKLYLVAAKRFSLLERKFEREPQLKERYAAVIKEYKELGHMEKVAKEDQTKPGAVYLPHHAVIREDKTTSKVRVVFDASCPGINGVSLNQDLLVGPRLQQDLRHILLRWRCFPISLVSDIVKMYRQVKVYDEDADFHRILWRDNQDEPVTHYKLLRVTFGTAAAPYLAVKALQQVAHDYGEAYSLAADRVLNDFYVDDLLSGCETVAEGEQIYKELNALLSKAGFELAKWNTNNEQLIKIINQDSKTEEGNVEIKMDTTIKMLGLAWNRKADTFEYAVQLPQLKFPITKRRMISDISRLFDPLGWLAPVIICAKIFIQKLWLTGVNWDDEVPPQLVSEWLSYRERLNQIANFSIPRWVHTEKSNKVLELQGFSDASNEAYAAVVYLRTMDEDETVHVSLITAKTKVAPIKQVSIPRLELCGAVLLTKLLVEVSRVMKIEKSNIHAWSDSTIVLSWLNSRPNRWKTFVANRVAEILTSLDPHQWSHVSSKDNPADCASRGTTCIQEEHLWKEGPVWLKDKDIVYPKNVHLQTDLEMKPDKICLLTTCSSSEGLDIIGRFSSLRRLIRVVAYCKRFMKCLQGEKFTAWLTTKEIQESLTTCIKLVQGSHFEAEIQDLKKKKEIKKSNLTSLNPFIDKAGLLRVGGRLQYACLSEDMKHPIIIPEKSHFTDLLISDAHERTLHGGPSLMLNYLRTKYFILGVKNLVKFYVRRCVTCIRYAASCNYPLMGQLPAARGLPSRPFRHSGVDYAGPISIRTSKGRGHHSYKGYICLFICMSTRAIHLEAVSDMTAQGFLAAFRRFVARRGHCSDIWSDNGTNFVGAARELKQLYADERSSIATEIADQLATNGTTWHFIPPHAPNFGGLWEAGVKSTKHHLRRIIGNTTLTFEEMSTVLAQIEACLNSRPICKGSDNSDAPEPLTPGHFLVTEPLVLVPDFKYETSNVNSLRRWQLTQKLVQHFWRRWSSEYLMQFYHRYKWAHQTPEPDVGDVVLVKEDGLPPSRWLYGIIVDKHPGADNITRVVSLKCKDNIIKRAVNKLCFLPVT